MAFYCNGASSTKTETLSFFVENLEMTTEKAVEQGRNLFENELNSECFSSIPTIPWSLLVYLEQKPFIAT